jgi:hypothetical protein
LTPVVSIRKTPRNETKWTELAAAQATHSNGPERPRFLGRSITTIALHETPEAID